ncbi:proteasome endopeptidase complex%2C archaeal%2C beta subunit [uncultured Clostridium sp.]|uniref:hypothetical protein n=1 Tax=uncultured Clostridium sp. TaxID=59620 RepID=UPI000822F02E|nr:hypothetical protein [uncultured Clostridium sp.]SCJ46860.1 proteasome endopeptidase complex%2C archaeal%2C beta subunit [uncultured Clostridium sp.]
MLKKIICNTIIFFMLITLTANATTIIAVIGENKIMLAADTRLTITKKNGEKIHEDNGKKLYKLKNGVGVAFAGDTNSIKTLRSGKDIITKSVSTIINDLNNLNCIEDLSVAETAELIAEKYVNLLIDYTGDILVVGFDNDEPVIYGIKAVKGRAIWQGISGKGSFWAIGSGSEMIVKKLRENVGCEENNNMDLCMDHLKELKDREILSIIKESLQEVIDDYEENYREDERSTGGKVDTLIIKP